MAKYQSPFKFPDEHMRLLGIIVAHWEALEVLIEVVLSEVMEHKYSRVALLASHVSLTNKLDLLTIYVRDAYGSDEQSPIWKEYNVIKNRISRAGGARNRFVHARWEMDGSTGQMHRHDIRIRGGKLHSGELNVSSETMAEAAQEIVDAGGHFTEFFAGLGIYSEAPA